MMHCWTHTAGIIAGQRRISATMCPKSSFSEHWGVAPPRLGWDVSAGEAIEDGGQLARFADHAGAAGVQRVDIDRLSGVSLSASSIIS